MSSDGVAIVSVDTDDRTAEAGFLMLGLAQMVSMFAFWIAIWPEAFGLPRDAGLGTWVGGLFLGGGALGFYLAFRTLSMA